MTTLTGSMSSIVELLEDSSTEVGVTKASLEGGGSVNTLTGSMSNIIEDSSGEVDIMKASMEGGSSVATLTGSASNIVEDSSKPVPMKESDRVSKVEVKCKSKFSVKPVPGGKFNLKMLDSHAQEVSRGDEENEIFIKRGKIEHRMKPALKVPWGKYKIADI